MIQWLELINRYICGIPVVILILGVGIFISWKSRLVQFRYFHKACRRFMSQFTGKDENSTGVTSYQALCTALAATVGTGNMAGVAGAIAIGGPGAVFWMWVCAALGMVTKFAEAALAVHYRVKYVGGELVGGPMYMIQQGLGSRYNWLAVIYCFFGVIASFGVGNATQINTVISSVNDVITAYGGSESMLRNLLLGAVLALTVAAMLSGGMKRIGRITEQLVPLASVFYVIICVGVLLLRSNAIGNAFRLIFTGALSPQAVTGGAIGSIFQVLRVGASRGVFTNEAGLGTASIAHASAQVDHPVSQGMMGIMEVFLDTCVICTMTALAILCCDAPIQYGVDTGVSLVNIGFASVYGDWICIPITIALCLFAVATILGWGLYGGRCLQYLFGDRVWKPYVFLHVITVVLGACLQTGTVWAFSEMVNGLMAIPNLIILAILTPKLVQLLNEYQHSSDRTTV